MSDALPQAQPDLDANGRGLVLFPVKKLYSDEGRRNLQSWWIKSIASERKNNDTWKRSDLSA